MLEFMVLGIMGYIWDLFITYPPALFFVLSFISFLIFIVKFILIKENQQNVINSKNLEKSIWKELFLKKK